MMMSPHTHLTAAHPHTHQSSLGYQCHAHAHAHAHPTKSDRLIAMTNMPAKTDTEVYLFSLSYLRRHQATGDVVKNKGSKNMPAFYIRSKRHATSSVV